MKNKEFLFIHHPLAANAGDADAQYELSLEVYYNTGL
jgi:hypothetical protein